MALMPLPRHRIQDVEMELLLLALKERWGYDFTGYARASLKRRLQHLAGYFNVDSLARLLPDLLHDERMAQAVINAISVPASEFFRDPEVWRYVGEEILPRLASFAHINLWQVGCGRGQESYTLAILLHEAGLLRKTRLVASDINPAFLAEARQGCWAVRDFAQWRDNYRQAGGSGCFDDYFEQHGGQVAIRESLKSAVEFVEHNLVADDAFLESQFIVCRNVLIYFGIELQQRVCEVFLRSLVRGGYLLLGRAESLPETLCHGGQLETVQEELRLYRKTVWGGHG